MATLAADLPECQDCGACCFADGPRYVRVSGSDHSRMDATNDSLTHFIGNRCYMRVLHGHCEALSITAAAHRFACLIYLTRPQPCRTLERGSGECLAELHRKQSRAGLAALT